MSERDEKRGGSGCAIGLVALLLLLPMPYVVGIGPAIWCAIHVPQTNDFLETMYTPLVSLRDLSRLVGRSAVT